MSNRMLGIDALLRDIIMSFKLDNEKSLTLTMTSGKIWSVELDDDGCGCNDSNAFFSGINLDNVLNQEITEAYEHEFDGYGGNLIIKTRDSEGHIEITHEQNGYYGFSYELISNK